MTKASFLALVAACCIATPALAADPVTAVVPTATPVAEATTGSLHDQMTAERKAHMEKKKELREEMKAKAEAKKEERAAKKAELADKKAARTAERAEKAKKRSDALAEKAKAAAAATATPTATK